MVLRCCSYSLIYVKLIIRHACTNYIGLLFIVTLFTLPIDLSLYITPYTHFSLVYKATMDKSGDNKLGFSFAKLVDVDNNKQWAREIQYSLEFAVLWDQILLDTENLKPAPIILKGKYLEDDAKLER